MNFLHIFIFNQKILSENQEIKTFRKSSSILLCEKPCLVLTNICKNFENRHFNMNTFQIENINVKDEDVWNYSFYTWS